MTMATAESVLVIILAIVLSLFLLVGIILIVKLIQVMNHLKRISEKAEKLASTAESVGELFKYTAGPAAIGKLVSNISEAVRKHHRNKKGAK